MKHTRPQAALFILAFIAVAFPALVTATPQFARQYRTDCSSCHWLPPVLNQGGEDFVARGYRVDEQSQTPSYWTLPLAVWNTIDLEYRSNTRVAKTFPSRIEIISAGTIGQTSVSYFAEWRVLSQQIGGNNRLLDRSGRFEDLYLLISLESQQAVMVTVGQFRALNQIDVSRRLPISEPLALSASVPGVAASSARLTSLRAFSPSGRQPGIRLTYHRQVGPRSADGWYSLVTLPLVGELTIPLAEASSFELEARPKGVFLESYYQRGLRSFGGHIFLGKDRSLGNLIARGQITERSAVQAAVGFSRVADLTDLRYSIGGEFWLLAQAVGGLRVDHRTKQQRDPIVVAYLNGHVPFGPPTFRQAFRVQLEHRRQPDNHVTVMGVSHIF